MARPPKDVDVDLVRKLASILCTMKEIAAICDCSVATLERRFADVINKAQETGRMSLRRWQYQAAEKGNTAMLIWLGKQHLGQTDRTYVDLTKMPDEALAQEAARRIALAKSA